MAITIAPRPKEIDGCMQTWSETYSPNTIRSAMDDMEVKVRRRTTGLIRTMETTLTLKAVQYDMFIEWFRVAQQGGSIPTRIKRPQDGKEMVVRASEPPQIQWIDKNIFQVSMKWEQMPAWVTL
jgi:hypothetical protein